MEVKAMFKNIGDLRAEVERNAGVLTVNKTDLSRVIQNVTGAQRAGREVLRRFLVTLAQHGLGFIVSPHELINGGYRRIRLYQLGTDLADKIITPVVEPGDINDNTIRRLGGRKRRHG